MTSTHAGLHIAGKAVFYRSFIYEGRSERSDKLELLDSEVRFKLASNCYHPFL